MGFNLNFSLNYLMKNSLVYQISFDILATTCMNGLTYFCQGISVMAFQCKYMYYKKQRKHKEIFSVSPISLYCM